MRWWLRIVTTLTLTPLLWGLIVAYGNGQLGAALVSPFLGTVQFFILLFTGHFAAIPGSLSAGGAVLSDAVAELPTALAPLWPIYLGATLPTFALLVLILTPAEYSLRRLGIDLITVFVMPVVAYFVTFAIASFVPDPPADILFGSLWLVALYGLVFGMTIREPRAPRSKARSRPA